MPEENKLRSSKASISNDLLALNVARAWVSHDQLGLKHAALCDELDPYVTGDDTYNDTASKIIMIHANNIIKELIDTFIQYDTDYRAGTPLRHGNTINKARVFLANTKSTNPSGE